MWAQWHKVVTIDIIIAVTRCCESFLSEMLKELPCLTKRKIELDELLSSHDTSYLIFILPDCETLI